jgi:hypothetical protein
MKRILLLGMFFGALLLPVFAEVDGGVRIDAGLDGLFIFFSDGMAALGDAFGDGVASESIPQTSLDFASKGILLPIGSLGIYGQMDLGNLHFGLGFRGYTYVIASLIWPAVYVEADFWKFTLNATVGGYGFLVQYFFLPLIFSQDIILPECSLWFRWTDTFRTGAGVITALDPRNLGPDYFTDFQKKLLFYIGARASLPVWGFSKRKAAAGSKNS